MVGLLLKRALKAFKRLLTHPNRRIAGKQTQLTAFSNELRIGNLNSWNKITIE